jgi:hypothetical protein
MVQQMTEKTEGWRMKLPLSRFVAGDALLAGIAP